MIDQLPAGHTNTQIDKLLVMFLELLANLAV